MEIESIELAKLVLDPSNARKHNPRNIETIKGSLAKFGQQKPIVVGKNGVIIAGNGTLEAARSLGWDRIDVVRTDLVGTDATAYALADNRTAELAEWDQDVLTETLRSLEALDFDLAAIGFDDFDLSLPPAEGLTDPDAVPENVETRCKPGDLWTLGNHRLLCGDSTNVQHVERLMGGDKADICFTSPPYNLGKFEVSGPKATNPSRKEKYLTCSDDMSADQFEQFLCDLIAIYTQFADSFLMNIALMEPNKRAVMRAIYRNIDLFKETLYWKKSTSTPHIQPGIVTSLVEPIFCFGVHNSRQFKTANFKGNCNNVIEGSNASGNEFAKIHAATFPAYLPEWVVTQFSRGDVIDPFMGSGTTLIACEKTGRRCFGMEIDPKYCDVILNRWEDFTGKTSMRLEGN